MDKDKEEKRHYFVTSKPESKVEVLFNNQVVAETTNALLLKEVGRTVYDQVYYIPREDVKMELLSKNTKNTSCPIKGEASYYDFDLEGTKEQDLAWSYEDPLAKATKIKGYLAFYGNKVTLKIAPV